MDDVIDEIVTVLSVAPVSKVITKEPPEVISETPRFLSTAKYA